MTPKIGRTFAMLTVLAVGLATPAVAKPPNGGITTAAVCPPGPWAYDGTTWQINAKCSGLVGAGGTYALTVSSSGVVTSGTLTNSQGVWNLAGNCAISLLFTVPAPHYQLLCALVATNATGATIIIDLTLWVDLFDDGSVIGYGGAVGYGQPFTGFTCGFGSTNDPSGQVVQDPNTQSGEVNGGPWAVPGASSVTITCSVSVGDGVVSSDDTAVSQTTAGSVGAIAAPIQYQAAPGVPVWLCTQVSWTYDDAAPAVTGGDGSWGGDLADPDGSAFCDEATSIEP